MPVQAWSHDSCVTRRRIRLRRWQLSPPQPGGLASAVRSTSLFAAQLADLNSMSQRAHHAHAPGTQLQTV